MSDKCNFGNYESPWNAEGRKKSNTKENKDGLENVSIYSHRLKIKCQGMSPDTVYDSFKLKYVEKCRFSRAPDLLAVSVCADSYYHTILQSLQ